MKKFFIISIVCFMSGMAMAQMADFTWYYTNGTPCVPGTVTFTNTSTNPSGIQSVDWDFGDNTTHATTMDAVHPYTTAGTFTVTLTVTYSNPSGSALKIGFNTTGGTVICAERTCTGSSYTFNFTDAELDRMYKQYGNSSTLSTYVILRTANTYYDTKSLTVTFKGNQKTIHDKVSGSWLRGKVWTKVSGSWKRAVIWTKVSGTWRRGI